MNIPLRESKCSPDNDIGAQGTNRYKAEVWKVILITSWAWLFLYLFCLANWISRCSNKALSERSMGLLLKMLNKVFSTPDTGTGVTDSVVSCSSAQTRVVLTVPKQWGAPVHSHQVRKIWKGNFLFPFNAGRHRGHACRAWCSAMRDRSACPRRAWETGSAAAPLPDCPWPQEPLRSHLRLPPSPLRGSHVWSGFQLLWEHLHAFNECGRPLLSELGIWRTWPELL